MSEATPGVSFHDLSSGGHIGELIREKDWSTSPLGPRASWPRSLNNHLSMIFELPTAAIIFWGPEQIQLYNDGYSVIMGPRHPQHLGSTFRDCWPEAYSSIDPWMQRVLRGGETVAVNRTLVPLTRFGFTEEAHFTFSFSPLRDDDGKVAGVLQLVTEVTQEVLGERRATVLRELSNQTARARTNRDAIQFALEALEQRTADLPFCLLYAVDPLDRNRLTLSGATGIDPTQGLFPADVDLGSTTAVPELRRAAAEQQVVLIENFGARFSGVRPAASEPLSLAFAAPIVVADQCIAVLVGGISPRLLFDSHYRDFVQLLCAQLSTLLSAARAHDDERRRVEALSELDRAKTEFFSNVSHEFRTPLTLILGPLEDALRDRSRSLQGAVLEAVHRNALRLLRLVNTLLDFARLEATRLTSSREPTDLAVLTGGLAGSFQSLLEQAGLSLQVECAPLSEPVWVDRSQWEKIVLNLVSNAFKFTFEGGVTVTLREDGDRVLLSVSDTGSGIPAEEIPNVFKRFHRVKGARGRSFEGTGIGLALVQELVLQHGGTVSVESTVGTGTTFTVSIPKRLERTDDEDLAPTHQSDMESIAAPYLLEAARWNARGGTSADTSTDTVAEIPATVGNDANLDAQARVLIADDNADMRLHLARLLSPFCSVETAEDGQAALEAALERPPDLILSDVMMPRMDGVALVSALRSNRDTSTIPIVLLSARAGEEAIVDGFGTGADDYLIKPFAARELLARVKAHLEMARLRREWARELQQANTELEAFSYSVSHDLRTPLRAIDGFSKVLIEEYADTLDEEGRRCLERIRSGTQRMGQIIDDLLNLSRITRVPLTRERVDVTSIARRILVELSERDPDRVVEAIVADGLVADADARLVAIVMENLLGNAWKFTSRRPHARIDFGTAHRENEEVLFVRDNGAGFEMEYASKLFMPFQRLHAQEDFDGTGIGLATVQRIVTRHGGRIWAEATSGGGATFYFTFAETP